MTPERARELLEGCGGRGFDFAQPRPGVNYVVGRGGRRQG